MTLFGIPVPQLDDADSFDGCDCSRIDLISFDSRKRYCPIPRKNASILPNMTEFGKLIRDQLKLDGNVPKITRKTMSKLLNGDFKNYYDNLFIIDCRYKYEYDGGHIPGAIHMNSPRKLTDQFFNKKIERTIIIFHCEFSHNRGPQIASLFREHDRFVNKDSYPEIYYPDTYVLEGGYKAFYEKYPKQCDGGYVKMLDSEHKDNGDLIKSTSHFRSEIDQVLAQKRLNLVEWRPKRNSLTNDGYDCPSIFQSPTVSRTFRMF
ncbi:Rhodanese-like domain containing protein [Tritrichomonas foetus]|uniref:protein-tyrosine-phosphatase n=1 Tax=Tritrichomonas foetus TaxID=1144522 RepID=A0A1J4JM85_9EUKA|nr:Rhodanese-like domain containing protein [Tritrichomonas foetus]|eukprot:OHS98675.1 Rhodanese-like domain containing protein [Tritrichomonas foetus]